MPRGYFFKDRILNNEFKKEFISDFKKGLSILALSKKYKASFITVKEYLENELGIMNFNIINEHNKQIRVGQHKDTFKIQKKILSLLEEHDLVRNHLCHELNIPRTTVYDNLYLLEQRGIVERYSMLNGEKGRPKIYWRLIKNV